MILILNAVRNTCLAKNGKLTKGWKITIHQIAELVMENFEAFWILVIRGHLYYGAMGNALSGICQVSCKDEDFLSLTASSLLTFGFGNLIIFVGGRECMFDS